MPAPRPESLPARMRRRLGWVVRDRFPNRPVVREVQGVTMTLPWSHRLPDYARNGSPYGQNLVGLAALLGAEEPLTMLDVGANVGDSALQVLAAVDARVLCVEADRVFLAFLRTNVGDDERCTIEPSLLATTLDESPLVPVRVGGTAHFVAGTADAPTVPTVTPAVLRARHPAFDRVRLVKSDTDGYDVVLVPAIAEAWADRPPVLFFEYDRVLSRRVGSDPSPVWAELAALGYTEAAIWDNGGRPLGRLPLHEVGEASRALDDPVRLGYHYWDVAVAHEDDPTGRRALADLVPDGYAGGPAA